MGRQPVQSLTLDAAALIAVERGTRRVVLALQGALECNAPVFVPAGVLAQTWRGGARQAMLAKFVSDPAVIIEPMTREQAKAIGILCGERGGKDIVDASVVLVARQHDSIVLTGDTQHLLHLDPDLRVERI